MLSIVLLMLSIVGLAVPPYLVATIGGFRHFGALKERFYKKNIIPNHKTTKRKIKRSGSDAVQGEGYKMPHILVSGKTVQLKPQAPRVSCWLRLGRTSTKAARHKKSVTQFG